MNHWEGKTIPTDYQPEEHILRSFRILETVTNGIYIVSVHKVGLLTSSGLTHCGPHSHSGLRAGAAYVPTKARHPQALSPVSFVT